MNSQKLLNDEVIWIIDQMNEMWQHGLGKLFIQLFIYHLRRDSPDLNKLKLNIYSFI